MHTWQLTDRSLVIDHRPLVMGVVNVTPDSFSDGGQFLDCDRAVEHGLRLVAEGADILDVGGESTRPGADPVSLDEESRRVIPVVERLAKRTTVPISIDTSKAEVRPASGDASVTGLPVRISCCTWVRPASGVTSLI